MKLERGNMWDVFGHTDVFLITTNPIRRKDGAVVMGRGIAKEAATRFPELPFAFGKRLPTKFSCGLIGRYDGQLVGYFMVKDHWNNPADPAIIQASVDSLIKQTTVRCMCGKCENDMRIDLNFPGIGNGKLKREDVLPIIEQLPDNVHVWEYGD